MTIEEANLPEPRFRCEGLVLSKVLRDTMRCVNVATVTLKGVRLCWSCAKKAAK